jgi:hypothetical protein
MKHKRLSEWLYDFKTHTRLGRFLRNVKWAILHRITHRYNIVHTRLKPGYYDNDIRMLYANFNLLVEYVEIELAWMKLICSEERNQVPWYMSLEGYRNKHAKRLGLEHLD